MKPELVLTWKDVEGYCADICRDILLSDWRPDYVVGITRGGSTPAVLISQYLNVPCHMLKVSLRDGEGAESNCWMAEDAYGYHDKASVSEYRKNILIVDDINDSGATMHWIKHDWEGNCFPTDETWNDIWHHNVQFAVLVENRSSEFKGTDFCGIEVDKAERDIWVVFPWEEWWKR